MEILVAEDDLSSRLMLKALLTKKGYEVTLAQDGSQAWEIIQGENPPQLMLLDWNMPGYTGPEICAKLREQYPATNPYVILLTAKDTKEEIVRGLDSGANDYVAKPFDPAELLARIAVGARMVELQNTLRETLIQMEYQATHDMLTNTLNRKAILELLIKEKSKVDRFGNCLSIGILDIDFFKKINDQYGHASGDTVLQVFTTIVKESLREYDLFGRIGGEEFLIVAPHTEGNDKCTVYQRICDSIANSNFFETQDGQAIPVTVSIGVSTLWANLPIDQGMEIADKALYAAKENGRNQVIYAQNPRPSETDS